MPATASSTILVLDGDATTRDLLQEFLVGEGYDVVVAGDVPSAHAALDRSPSVLVIAAVDTPGGGTTMVQELRQHPAQPSVIVLTAQLAIDALRRAEALGADGHVNKPIDLDILLSGVRDVLNQETSPRTRDSSS